MPELNPRTIREAYQALAGSNQVGKFVRHEKLIIWGHESTSHTNMLQQAGVSSLHDHGFLLAFVDGKENYLTVSLQSNGLNTRDFPVRTEERFRTAQIIKGFSEEASFPLEVHHEL